MKFASKVKHMHVGDLYVSMDGDPQPFWRTKSNALLTLGNDGTTWVLDPGPALPAKRIHKNFRSEQ
jgi:hypothetical protein